MIRWLYYALRRWYYRNIYLRSWHWRAFRLKALEAAEWECEYPGCNTTDTHHPAIGKKIRTSTDKVFCIESLDVHHLTYENLWHEKLKDVTVLCRRHHIMVEKERYPQ